jgi:OmpA-OmpF porin, OOP family
MKIISFSLTILFFAVSNIANAQFVKDYKRNADNFYKDGDYKSAAQYYEKYLKDKKGPSSNNGYSPYGIKATAAKPLTKADSLLLKPAVAPKGVSIDQIEFRIGECYRHLADYKSAEPWYAKAVAIKEPFPLAPFHYGVCLRALGKYDEAQTVFNKFLETYTEKNEFSAAAQVELDNLKFITKQIAGKEKNLYAIAKMPKDFNSDNHLQNTAPFVINNITYFTSCRKDTNEAKKANAIFRNNIYTMNNGVAQRLEIPNSKNTHQGAATFTPNGSTMYFTKWSTNPVSKNSAIFKSNKTDNNNWSEPEKLSVDINVEGYNSQQPIVTADGKYLLFASDKPGGKGKFDIWYATLDNDKIGKSENLGESINSAEDEETPFYHLPSKTLVFASQGRVGMGGFDLFSSKGNLGSSFSNPINMGYPVNSSKHEQYFFSNDDKFLLRNFMISSDRESQCCLELFSASKIIKKYVKGRVVDSKTKAPLAGVGVTMIDETGNPLAPSVTDANGNYFFEANPYNSLNGTASKQGFTSSSETETNTDFNIDTVTRNDWNLEAIETPPPPPPPPPVVKPLIVRFDFNKSVIPAEYKESLDSLASLMKNDPTLIVEIGGHTDGKGTEEYNLNLAQKRANAGKAYVIEKYGIAADRIVAKAYGKCCPIETETNADGTDNEEARNKNRRLEFKMNK